MEFPQWNYGSLRTSLFHRSSHFLLYSPLFLLEQDFFVAAMPASTWWRYVLTYLLAAIFFDSTDSG